MNNTQVIGAIDQETRCKHYHSEKDRIAIKFYCCNQYFSCLKCHAENGCGHTKLWPKEMFHYHAVLCGSCRSEFTIRDYLFSMDNQCPSCFAAFNPNCSIHHSFYFNTK